MELICLDLEGVLAPEIWISLAKETGIESLSLTTRDIPNYDELMNERLKILKLNRIHADKLFSVASKLEPLEGAFEFLNELRKAFQVIILSDTFFELAKPIFDKLSWPTVFCHTLEIGKTGFVEDYKIRLKDHKKEAVQKFKSLNYRTIAVGDSYNDLTMLKEADLGILFRSTKKIILENKYFNHYYEYSDLMKKIIQFTNEKHKGF